MESFWSIFKADLMRIPLCFEIPATHYSCNSLKCVWELTKEVKQLIFSKWILSLLYCLYLEVAVKNDEACRVKCWFW